MSKNKRWFDPVEGELKPNINIDWFDLLEYDVVQQIDGCIATIYYMSSSRAH